jgi:ribosomal protein S18 acetylase RimI-like enzyme
MTARLATRPVRLRAERLPKDEAFLVRLFADARAHVFGAMPLPPEQKAMLVTQQFHTQRFSYQAQFTNPAPLFRIIEQDRKPVGRLYTHETAAALHIIDIALAAEVRGQGIGGRLMERLIAQAHSQGKAVTLSVEADRPARRLYERLGFRPDGAAEPPYMKMRLDAPAG